MNKSILSSLALAVILLSGLSACGQPALPAGPTAALPAPTAPLPTPTELPPAPTDGLSRRARRRTASS